MNTRSIVAHLARDPWLETREEWLARMDRDFGPRPSAEDDDGATLASFVRSYLAASDDADAAVARLLQAGERLAS